MKFRLTANPQKRFFLLLCAVLVFLVIGILGSTVYAVSYMKKKSTAISDLKSNNDLFDDRSLAAQKSKKQLAQYKSFQAVADRILPKDKEQSNSLVEITKIAQASGLTVTGITYSDGKAAAPTDTATPGNSTTKLTQTFPVDGLPNILGMQVDASYSTAIPFDKLIKYLEDTEKNQRKIQITSLELLNFDPAKGLVQLKRATMRFYLRP